ncbi:transcription termination/antitermination NusG family protein [Bosea sp. 124]|uniref:transcription termination/antitermination protein NusG n=1 Tax=Bosea sp. 124 TaxID=2135642 RepID=UPI000D38E229|nr:transcription termination/antitermination NusG family protein [Bosea sp. 124]PTM41731.1 transcriptional antiterminator RfaH [Bosea sp. 124]
MTTQDPERALAVPPTAASRPWIVVNTQVQRERLAAEHIGNQGFETYCPLFKRQIRHARRIQEVMRPLFPGYVFVAVDPQRQQWRMLMSTIGVRAVLRDGERPSILDGRFIETLRAREVAGAISRPAEPYQVGEKVRITSGAFDGLVAEIVRLDDVKRLTVMLSLLSSQIRTSLSREAVAPLELR